MNERIRELAEQASHQSPDGYPVTIPYSKDFAEKFAELIVSECVKVAVFKDSGTISTAQVAGYMAAGRATAAQMIREHFGVEE